MGGITRRLAKLEAKRAKATPAEYRVIWADDDDEGPIDEAALIREIAEEKAKGRRLHIVVIRGGEEVRQYNP